MIDVETNIGTLADLPLKFGLFGVKLKYLG